MNRRTFLSALAALIAAPVAALTAVRNRIWYRTKIGATRMADGEVTILSEDEDDTPYEEPLPGTMAYDVNRQLDEVYLRELTLKPYAEHLERALRKGA